MALTRTDVGSWASTASYGTGSFATGSFTPPANSLLLIFVTMMGNNTSGDLGQPTISGGSLSYSLLSSAYGSPAYSHRVNVFTATVGASPSSMTITVDDDTNQNIYTYGVAVVAFTGYNSVTPTAGVVTSGSTDIGDGSETQTLSATPATNDVTLFVISLDADTAPTLPTMAAGWTKIYDVSIPGGGASLVVARRESSTSTTVTCTDVYTATGTLYKGSMISFIVKAGAAGQSATLGIQTETDTLQTIVRKKIKALGILTETNILQVITRRHNRSIGLLSETDSLFATSRRKSRTTGILSGTDTLQAVTRRKTKSTGIITETDVLQTITRRKNKTLGLPTETDILQALTRKKYKTLAQISDTEILLNLGRSIIYQLGILQETDSLLSIARKKNKTLSLLSTVESVQHIASKKLKTLGELLETDVLFPITTQGKIVYLLGVLSETDSIFAIEKRKIKSTGLLSETDLLLSLSHGVVYVPHYIYMVPAENRVYIIPAAETEPQRIYIIPNESRVYEVLDD